MKCTPTNLKIFKCRKSQQISSNKVHFQQEMPFSLNLTNFSMITLKATTGYESNFLMCKVL